MTNIDQFESAFKSADKEMFAREDIVFPNVAIVTDKDGAATDMLAQKIDTMFREVPAMKQCQWHRFWNDDFSTVDALLGLLEEKKIELVCTYRNLKSSAAEHPFTLGTYVDVLTQATSVPILLLPRPDRSEGKISENTDRVMAITDHLTGDHHLVSVAAAVTQPQGTLYLTHVEDEAIFGKYVDTISKIPTLNTDNAEATLRDQLLKLPHDYISSCRQVLAKEEPGLQIQEIVTMGHRLRDYQRLIKTNEIDLLVLNTKDDDQLAMHGLAYPLTVELQDVPLLLV